MSLLDESFKPLFTRQYGTYVLDKYLIMYDLKFKIETYSCEWYYGIIFHLENGDRYDVVHNIYMGNRLIMRKGYWGSQDIPFKPSSFGCLPKGIETIEIGGD